MRVLLTITVLLGLLGLSVGVALWAWQQLGQVEISTHGLIALALGAGLTFALGVGLMALVFFSNRRGYDERAHRPDDEPSWRDQPNAPPRDFSRPPDRR